MYTVNLEDLERTLEQRKAALGYTGRDFVAPNSGQFRAPAKTNLLRFLREVLRRENRPSPFSANF